QFPIEREGSPSSLTLPKYISNSNLLNATNSGEQTLSPVWKYFNQKKTQLPGHFLAECSYCPAKWSRGEPQKLEAHLALECPNVNNEIRQIYLLCSCLTKYFPQKEGENLSEEQINSINSSLLKAFVTCSISFSIIENLFFIDLLQNLCSNYQPPSREVLSGRLLDQEYSRVTVKHEAIFNESENLTLEHTFASHLVKECTEIIKFFKKSYQPNSHLHYAISELKIFGGGLKKFIDTRWTSTYEYALSFSRLECTINNTSYCFLQFIQLAAAIKKVLNLQAKEFKSYCVQIFNKRWRDFNADNYLLAYFLHTGAGLREQQFQSIVITTIKIWQQEGHNQYECANLELFFFGNKLLCDDLQEQVASATFLVANDKSIAKDSEIEVIKHFDIENIVFLNDEMFQDGGSDIDNKELQSDSNDELDECNDEDFDVSKIGQDSYENIDECSYENNDNNLNRIDKCVDSDLDISDLDIESEKDNSENSIIIENDNKNLESLPIAI
ncbi:17244_t:CDS:2, partial [Cetraspora pellucida]